jgi:predicted glycoside hydrolase/deacetylase ChbG (UPF0249 family)
MVNMPDYEAAASLRTRFPRCSVGIHWTLTQGRPVLPASRIPTLVSASGEFHTIEEFRKRWMQRRIRRDDVRSELRAQHDRLLRVAGSPDFWNTHQDSHLLPGLFQCCVAVGRDLGIPAMRCHRRFTIPFLTSSFKFHITHPVHWLKGKLIARWSRKAEHHQMRMPDGRLYMPGYKSPSVASLEDVVDRLPWSTIRRAIEVIVHPAARVEQELFGNIQESRVKEYEVLSDPGFVGRLQRRGIAITSFETVRAAN